jgi:pimeloyl-ACP methyl ester carboxylesterase
MNRASLGVAARGDPFVHAWFNGGQRIGYDPASQTLVDTRAAQPKVFVRHEGDISRAISFLPGFPDGSIGWAKVIPFLPDAASMPKLFVEYLGMGDSDKPKHYRYSTAERTDLVETLWRDLGVKSTTLVAFDFSSLVVLEHLRRRLERAERGEPVAGPDIRGIIIFNGGLFTDGHSHPWFTTPVLRRPGGAAAPWLAKRSFYFFKQLAAVMWSKGYRVQDQEVRQLYEVMNRHDGLFYLSRAAGFVAEHKAEHNRLDFRRLYDAYREQIPFLVGGSLEDPFEQRQIALSEERLGKYKLRIERLPGGHLTTFEQPGKLAALITNFEWAVKLPLAFA